MIIPNDRYTMPESENSMYAAQMILSIRKLHKNDFGGYKCISKNSIGDAEGLIRLYGELFLLCKVERLGFEKVSSMQTSFHDFCP